MKITIIRVPFLIPRWAAAQVLLPRIIFVRRDVKLTQQLLAHELRHVRQLAEFGMLRFYWLMYLAQLIGYGYASHPMEAEALQAEKSILHLRAASVIIDALGPDGAGTVAVPDY